MTAGDNSERQRLFFALWPPADVAERIAVVGRALATSGAPVPRDKLHVTLAFHGARDAVERRALIARAERVAIAPFDLVFDWLDGFDKPRLIWLGLSRPPAALFELAEFLRADTLDPRAFVPHITLQRRAGPITARPVAPIAWRAREFVLAESGAQGVPGGYRILARWPLAGESGPGENVK
ncbi:RNA 2',3'-cyclic phosphodiesterase [Salinisphaera hydrothermalis]|uniref:RNA 2',3'-cyclic phosphodiesterase n=1 Tax=Salinisphaera hydrothermalis TaxID=563188 RepID=UPI00333EBCCD